MWDTVAEAKFGKHILQQDFVKSLNKKPEDLGYDIFSNTNMGKPLATVMFILLQKVWIV